MAQLDFGLAAAVDSAAGRKACMAHALESTIREAYTSRDPDAFEQAWR